MSAEDFEYLLEELEENNVYENAIEQMMDELVDEVTLGLCFEVHRSVKKGTFFLDDNEKEKEDQFKIVIERGLDIFGQVPIKAKQVECVCPNCSRNLAASRFAPHLEKCMGMGRTSSRVASRRIARVGKKESDEDSDKEDEDDDWTFVPEKRTKKIKKDKHGHKNSPKGRVKHKNGDVSSISGSSEAPTYESLSISERKDVLKNTCGVISEHTKKMCTRSLRCPQHSDDQRKAVRLFLLRSPPGLTSNVLDDEATIDIDTYDVSESKTMRDCLTWEASSNQPSPADSSSTTNSGSSFRKKTKTTKKRESKTSSASGRNSNLDSRSNTNTPTKLYDFE